jgi:uroporphyrin-3 C-methyltransferase
MNDATPPSPPVLPPASAPAAPTPPAAAPARGGVATAALVVAVVALVMAGVLWQRLGDAQEQLARRAQDTAEAVTEARTLAAQAEATSQELQARLSVAEVRLSEVSLQRTQLEELMLSLSRSRDDNLVQDLESALRLAQQQAQLTGSAQPLVSALKAADQRIARAAQPRLNPVQRAIARDIERLQSAALADIPALALQLDELARQVDNFPLLNQVGPRAGARPVAPPTAPLPPDDSAVAVLPAGDGWWARAGAWWSQRWAALVSEVTASGRELVRVSRIDRPEASLVAPEQAFFLRENLKLKLLNARLALLARHMSAAQADVVAVQAALNRYFDTSAAPVRGALTALGRLQRELVDTPLPRPDDTLQALTAAAGGR